MTKSKLPLKFFCKSSDGQTTYLTDDNFLYAEKGGSTIRLDLFDSHYYKLRPFNDGVILEIDGLRMQLVRDFKTPLDYSKEVVRELGISKSGAKLSSSEAKTRGKVVFDSCMGLGYTAIAAAESNAVESVVTCEFSKAVLTLAQWNPFSEMLFSKGTKIVVMEGNSADLVKTFSDSMFDYIIHDPPRISHATELYSTNFYKELYRVCKPGARMFHYFGSVGVGKGRRIDREVVERLKGVGFGKLRLSKKLQGVFAEK